MAELYSIDDLNLQNPKIYVKLYNRCPDIKLHLYEDHEYMIYEGDTSASVFLIISGSYVVEQVREDESVPPIVLEIASISPESPAFVGEMAYLGEDLRNASVRSSGATYTMYMKPRHLNIIIEEFPEFTKLLSRQFCSRLTEKNEIIKELLNKLTMKSEQIHLNPGEFLFRKGHKSDTLYQLICGTLIKKDKDGEGIISRADLPHGFLNTEEYFRCNNFTYSVFAETHSIVIGIAESSKKAVIRNYPELVIDLL